MKFIHAADVHLDSPLVGLEQYEGAPVDEIRGATRQALDNLVRLAIDEKVSFVVIAGDLYDGDWKDYNTALFLSRKMSDLREAGIPVYIVSGNHDAASSITRRLNMPGNVKIFKTNKPGTIVNEELGIAVHGQGYARYDLKDNLAASYPDPLPGYLNIGLLHTCLNGREGHESYAPCRPEELKARGYQYWALGHVHAFEVVDKNPWIVFSGNIQGRHIREQGPKGCVLVTAEDNQITGIEHVELDVMRWASLAVDVSEAGFAPDVVDIAGDAVSKLLGENPDKLFAVRLKFEGAFAAHGSFVNERERWVTELRARVSDIGRERAWLEKVSVKTTGRAELETLLRGDDVLAGLVKNIMDLSGNREMLDAIAEDFEELGKYLPGELTSGEEKVELDSDDTYLNALEDVKQIIIDRILSGGVDVADN